MKLFGKFRKDNKGQVGMAGPMANGVMTVFGLFFIGILIFSFALAGGEMSTATTNPDAIDAINKTVEGVGAFANFSPTLWIMTAIGVLIAILIGSVGIYFFNRG